MGRKPITPSQRSIPVSFSVKPVLADRIEEMAYDQRFTRSKFLSEAVLRYINWIEMGGLEGTDNVAEMSATRKVVIGMNALGAAVREQDFSIPNNILQDLSRAIDFYKMSESNAKSKMQTSDLSIQVASGIVTKTRYAKGEYTLWADGEYIGRAKKVAKNWRAIAVQSPDFQIMFNPTLKGLIEIIQISVDNGDVTVVA